MVFVDVCGRDVFVDVFCGCVVKRGALSEGKHNWELVLALWERADGIHLLTFSLVEVNQKSSRRLAEYLQPPRRSMHFGA